MDNKKGFDNEKYLREQSRAIQKRVSKFDKLYLEIGGRLTRDGHAARVLPGYEPHNKLKLLKKLGKDLGVLYCISSSKLESGATWSDTGLTLDKLAMKETKMLEEMGIEVMGIVATRFSGEKKVLAFKKKLARSGKNLYFTYNVSGYPTNMKSIFGPKGFSAQDLIPTNGKKIIAITGAGANSGKMFVCLSQVFLCEKGGLSAGYAKQETFPIWNLPLNHPVNVAYEAATADIGDVNMLDPFHKKAYGINAVNYNRDIENFAILKRLITRMVPKSNFMHSYKSPTDMGLNMAKKAIIDDSVVQAAGRAEVMRRYKFYSDNLKGKKRAKTLKRMDSVLREVGMKLVW